METTLALIHQSSRENSSVVRTTNGQTGRSDGSLVVREFHQRDASVMTSVLGAASATSNSNGIVNGLGRPLLENSGFLLDVAGYSPNISAIERSNGGVQHDQDPEAPPPSLCGLFESSASFLPDTYVMNCNLPKLFCYHISELEAKEFTRINHCTLFYAITPRQWIRLTLSITATFDSEYWILRVPSMDFNSKNRLTLPFGLTSKMTSFLEKQPTLRQDVHLSLFLGKQSRDENNEQASPWTIKFAKPLFDVRSYLQQITSAIRHLNCPWYLEKDLQRRPLDAIIANNLFITFFQSRFVLEFRFGSSKPQIDYFLYNLQVLQCLNGSPGVSPFIGVLLDSENGVITAFMCELPAKGSLPRALKQANDIGQPIPLQRRIKWCRQIVQGVAQIHSQGFVIGFLGETPDFIAIDAEDKAVFYRRFSTTFAPYQQHAMALPPEYHRMVSTMGSLPATPPSDLFQLGLIIWSLVAHKSELSRSDSYETTDCMLRKNDLCKETHDNSVQPPPWAKDTPQYIVDIIAACRSVNPDERLPAWRLLEMFQASLDLAGAQPDVTKSCPLTRIEDCVERYGRTITCDRCSKLANDHFFHCKICTSGDYDICPGCFKKGLHCLGDDHYLQEYCEKMKDGK